MRSWSNGSSRSTMTGPAGTGTGTGVTGAAAGPLHAIARWTAIAMVASACRPTPAPAPPTRIWLGGDVFLAYPGPGRLAPLTRTLDGPGFVNLEGPVTCVAEVRRSPGA